jgi:hypothetical protein
MTSLTEQEEEALQKRKAFYLTLNQLQERMTIKGIADEILGIACKPKEKTKHIAISPLVLALAWFVHRTARRSIRKTSKRKTQAD